MTHFLHGALTFRLGGKFFGRIGTFATLGVRRKFHGLYFFYHFQHNFLSPILPFVAILHRVVQIFVRRYTKNTAILQFLGQWYDIEIKETNFPLVPIRGGIRVGASQLVRLVAFLEETLIPLSINMPLWCYSMGTINEQKRRGIFWC